MNLSIYSVLPIVLIVWSLFVLWLGSCLGIYYYERGKFSATAAAIGLVKKKKTFGEFTDTDRMDFIELRQRIVCKGTVASVMDMAPIRSDLSVDVGGIWALHNVLEKQGYDSTDLDAHKLTARQALDIQMLFEAQINKGEKLDNDKSPKILQNKGRT
jgi:hypothetical protein